MVAPYAGRSHHFSIRIPLILIADRSNREGVKSICPKNEWAERSARYPSAGPILTYKPEASQLRAHLMTTMSKSRIAKIQQYHNSLLLPDNALKPYDDIYKASKAIEEGCAKDTIANKGPAPMAR